MESFHLEIAIRASNSEDTITWSFQTSQLESKGGFITATEKRRGTSSRSRFHRKLRDLIQDLECFVQYRDVLESGNISISQEGVYDAKGRIGKTPRHKIESEEPEGHQVQTSRINHSVSWRSTCLALD